MRRSISTKLPEIGRFDHVASGVMWNKHQRALVAARAGYQRRAVGEVRPGALDDVDVGSASTCRVTVTSARRREIGEGAGRRKFGDGLRRRPGQRAAHGSARRGVAAQVAVPRHCRPRQDCEPAKRTSVPPFFHPFDQLSRALHPGMVPTSSMTIIAGFCVEDLRGSPPARSGLAGSAMSAKGYKGAGDVEERRQAGAAA